MIISLEKKILTRYIEKQLNYFFPDNVSPRSAIISVIDNVLERVEYCFSYVHNKYFKIDGGQTIFNHLNCDHYAMFLYLLSNTLFKKEEKLQICEKIFYLNKILHGIDVFYNVELPDIFLFCHPIGTVLGRAQYSDYFLVYQGCTVGASREAGVNNYNEYPILGNYLALYMGAAILGKCRIGNNCKIANNSIIMDKDIPDNSVYIGTTMSHMIKENKQNDAIWDS